MTEDKERDEALIAEKERLADILEKKAGNAYYAITSVDLRQAAAILRGDEQPALKPDRAEVLFDKWFQTTSVDTDFAHEDKVSLIAVIRRHFDELRAEWEAERLEIPPHKHYSTPLIERLNGPHEWGYRDPVEGGFIADMSPFEASDRLSELEAERPAVVVPREAKLWADSVGYCSATRYEERTTAKWIKSLDGAKGDE